MREIIDRAAALSGEIIRDRRELHKIPEPGVYLPKTSAYVKSRLKERGIAHRDCGVHSEPDRKRILSVGYQDMPESTGVTALIGQGKPCILLRADMDALPIRETTGLPFAADSPFGHMCGHDSHTAMLLGAARILKEMEGSLKGSVKLMFQPGEELGYGSRTMVEDGILENPAVDAALAIHVMSQIPAGKAQYSPGVASSSLDTFIVKIQGRGGHSSAPQDTVDPNVIAAQLYNAVYLVAAREVDPKAFVVLNALTKNSGVSNVIPDSAEFHFGFRTLDLAARDHLIKRMPEIIEKYVSAWRGTCEIIQFNTPSTVCDEAFGAVLEPYVGEVLGREQVSTAPPMAGAEDFGYVSAKTPAMFLQLGAGGPGSYPLHNPNMTLDESVFALGSAIYANCAAEWLKKQSL
ncbi:MAG: amidohydrolase [Treponema sp.]|jgi:amidohydrolase|nr:amidohydrolase [Treponema sp.]